MFVTAKAKRVIRDYQQEFSRLRRLSEGRPLSKDELMRDHALAWPYALHKNRLPAVPADSDMAVANLQTVLDRLRIDFDSLPDRIEQVRPEDDDWDESQWDGTFEGLLGDLPELPTRKRRWGRP